MAHIIPLVTPLRSVGYSSCKIQGWGSESLSGLFRVHAGFGFFKRWIEFIAQIGRVGQHRVFGDICRVLGLVYRSYI